MSHDGLVPAEIVRELAARMKEKNLDPRFSKPWTLALKDCIREMLQGSGENVTDVLYSDRESDKHEFLLDTVVWSRNDGEGVLLAVESEWLQDVGAIEEDFWKLLVIKAPIKLMIFASTQNAWKHNQQAIWERLTSCLLKYRDHQADEVYVFMDYAPAPVRSAWWIEIPANGKLTGLPERGFVPFE